MWIDGAICDYIHNLATHIKLFGLYSIGDMQVPKNFKWTEIGHRNVKRDVMHQILYNSFSITGLLSKGSVEDDYMSHSS